MRLFDYAGCIHFHSKHSLDGYIGVPEIISAARDNQLDFIMLTDHSNLDARPVEGWHGDTLLIVGQEISPRFNHYIAFRTTTPIVAEEDETSFPQRYIDEVKNQGGIGFIAHPDHEGAPVFHVKHYPWLDWSVSGFAGMSIWDFMTDWQSSLTGNAKALISFMFPALVLKGPKEATLKRWDVFSQTKKVVGIGEIDNHAVPRSLGVFRLRVFSFQRIFGFIRTHVVSNTMLSRDNEKDVDLVLQLLKEGRAYVAMEYYRKAEGFMFSVSDERKCAVMGDTFALEGNAILTVIVPRKGRSLIRLVKDGNLYAEHEGTPFFRRVRENGVYRAEVFLWRWRKWRPWIFSNPIYVQ